MAVTRVSRRKPPRKDLSAEYLVKILDYDPETGIFRWRQREDRDATWNTRFSGKIAGNTNSGGYVNITIDYSVYGAHRLAYLYVTGLYPAAEIDHIDGNPANNSYCNLRPATRAQNGRNRKMSKNNKSGYKGVCFADGKWMATIEIFGKSIYLGRFPTSEAAHAAYCAAAARLHSEFARFS